MREYYIEHDEDSVSISLKPLDMDSKFPDLDFFCDAFINICVADEINKSPFKTVDDAMIFAEAIVKLLRSVDVIIDDIE